MNFHIITIFPNIFSSYLNESLIKRALDKKIINVLVYDLRKWTIDKHHTVDDIPYGGGAGMLMKAQPIIMAIDDIKNKLFKKNKKAKIKTVLFSAKGEKWQQKKAQTYNKYDDIIMICGRYEGVDERVLKFVDEEVSIGDYVLTGGEIPALILVDSISRLIPGTLGNKLSCEEESHSSLGLGEYPQYTRPEIIEYKNKKYKTPKILLSGNHQEIEKWRKKNMKKLVP